MNSSQNGYIDDETLSAFLDGELSTEQAEQIEQAINDDAELAARVESLAKVNELASQAYQEILHDPIPQHLIDAVRQQQPVRAEVISLASRKRFMDYVPMAVAASVALVVGSLLGYQIGDDGADSHSLVQADAGLIVMQNPLYIALEQTPSLQHYEMDNGDVIVPVMSFQADDGRYCREFQINSDQNVSVGVACKENNYWNTQVLLAAGSRPVDSTSYQPASGYSQEILDTVLDQLWMGVAYDVAEEQALIQKGWR